MVIIEFHGKMFKFYLCFSTCILNKYSKYIYFLFILKIIFKVDVIFTVKDTFTYSTC